MQDYSKNLIKDYNYWSVYLHKNQGILGRVYVWCKRKDALDLPDATEEEQKELFSILKEMERVLTKAFKPDIFNYTFLGNATHHLHCHILPRYSKPVEFNGQVFVDKNWGHNYKTDHSFVTTSELLEAVKNKIKENLF
ncbi:MAG: HIT domain-containing protein [Candidatus Paceibacterota bacterium]|jgi:diadenosine tetraphosphate (Ap4A) HIT family hydrolase